MTKAQVLRRAFEANIACGDIGEDEIRRMLAAIAVAEEEEAHPSSAQSLGEQAA